jgi:MFS family permease
VSAQPGGPATATVPDPAHRVRRAVAGYRAIFVAPGAASFVAAGFVSRLTTAMIGVGLILAVTDSGGHYGQAGAIVGVLLAANAVAGPAVGRLADRLGQDRVLARVALGFGLAMSAMIVGVREGASAWLLYLLAVACGVTMPVAGPMVRTRWTTLFAGSDRLRTAYAFESVTVEVVYILGPVLVTALAIGISPLAGLILVLVCAVGGTLALAAQRSTQPPPAPATAGRRARALSGPLLILCAAQVGVGIVYGSIEIVTVAFATAEGHRGATGLLLALWCVGSILSGLVFGAIALHGALGTRLAVSAIVMTIALVPLAFVPLAPAAGLALFAALLVIGGLGLSPLAVTLMEVLQRVVASAALTEAIAWVTAALAMGMMLGSLLGGLAVQHGGMHWAFAVPPAGAALAMIAVLAGAVLLRPAKEETT